MHVRALSALGLVSLLSGCSLLSFKGDPLDEDNFFEKYSEQICKVEKECFRGHYDSTWDDFDECVDDWSSSYEDVDYSDCDFDEDAAADCLDDMKAASCADYFEQDEDIFENCYDTFDCGR